MVDDMAQTGFTPLQNAELDRFLLAPVGEEKSGMTLSVLSALARLNVDPWEETAALAAMPRDRAKLRLAALIANTTKTLCNALRSEVVAARLVDLLPAASGLRMSTPIIPLEKTKTTSFTLIVVVGVLIAAAYLTTHFA